MGERPVFRVLVLGGTGEAVAVAEALAESDGTEVILSFAGQTQERKLPRHGTVRIGGFGGVDALADYLRDSHIDYVVDATHPYAARISANAHAACQTSGLPLVRLQRPPWVARPQDNWMDAANNAAAARLCPKTGARAFLTVGRKELATYRDIDNVWFLIRSIERPRECDLPANHVWISGRGPFSVEDELALLRDHRIDVLIAKNSGGSGTYAKIAAARQLGLPVIMIQRPPPPGCETVSDVPAVIERVRSKRT